MGSSLQSKTWSVTAFTLIKFSIPVRSLGGLVKGSHDVVVSVNEKLNVLLHGDLGTSVLGEEDGVANLNVDGAELSVVEDLARSGGNNDTVARSVSLTAGEDNSGLGLGFGDGFLDHNTVEKRLEGLEGEHKI